MMGHRRSALLLIIAWLLAAVGPAAAVQPGDVVVTEIMKDTVAVADPHGEWFEVLNRTGSDIDLDGWEIHDYLGDSHVIDDELIVPAGGFAVLGRNGEFGSNGGVDVDYEYVNFILTDGHDEIVLHYDGVDVDEVIYDSLTFPDTPGHSLNLDPLRIHPTLNDDPGSWCTASSPYGQGDHGTPGGINPSCCLDDDGDGISACDGDCDNLDPTVHPGATELCDGLDNDCNGAVDDVPDVDGDGYDQCTDCNDADPAVHPGALELCDGLDTDCEPSTDENVDGDGDGCTICGGDCDDTEPAMYPAATESCDGLDNDCDPVTDEWGDVDGDGLAVCEGDCDDLDAAILPGAAEVCDGVDNDCDGVLGVDEVDADDDGSLVCAGDCDDTDPWTYPGAPEQCDLVDNDCDGLVDEDAELDGDGDGFTPCEGDCNDLVADVYPGAPEICDGYDDDCDGAMDPFEVDEDGDGALVCAGDCDDYDPAMNLDDADGDGFTTCAGDCDDADESSSPAHEEVCDGLDNDCNGLPDDVDADGDLHVDAACGGDDCDDGAAGVYPGADEVCDDGLDNDCDGDTDEDDEDCADDPVGDDDTTEDDVGGDDDGGDPGGGDGEPDGEPETGTCACQEGGGPRAAALGSAVLLLVLAWIGRRRTARVTVRPRGRRG